MTSNLISSPEPLRDHRFDFFRGIAILLVIVLHAAVLTPNLSNYPILFTILSRCSIGMQLFFIISGYMISKSWARLSLVENGLRIYLIKRLAKLYPLYILFLAINIGVWFVFSQNDSSFTLIRNAATNENVTFANIFIHIFFLQGFSPVYLHSLVDGSWSIVNEAYYYILYPLILNSFCKSIKSTYICYLICLVISLAVPYALRFTPSGYSYYFFLSQMPCFILGILMYRILENGKLTEICAKNSGIIFVSSTVLLFGMIKGNFAPLGYHHLYGLALCLLVLGTIDELKLYSSTVAYKFVVLTGRQSYALFFLHLLIIKMQVYLLCKYYVIESAILFFALNILAGLFGALLLSVVIINKIDLYFVNLSGKTVNKPN